MEWFSGTIEDMHEVRLPLVDSKRPTKEYVASLRNRIKALKVKHVTVSRINVNSTLTTSVQVKIGRHLHVHDYNALLGEISKDMDTPRSEFSRDACGSPMYNHVSMLILTYNPTAEWDAYVDQQSRKRKLKEQEKEDFKKFKTGLYLPGRGEVTKNNWKKESICVEVTTCGQLVLKWPDVNSSYNRYFQVYHEDTLLTTTTETEYHPTERLGGNVAVVMCAGPADRDIEENACVSIEHTF